jgi:hypothetical protein
MDDIYEFIKGKKYKKCKENEFRNPITMRCNKIKTEIKKQISNDYKECPPDKIYNKDTNRCVLKTGAIGKKILQSLIQNKTKYEPKKDENELKEKEKELKKLKETKKKLKEQELKELKKLKEKETKKKLKEQELKELKKLKEKENELKELKKLKEKENELKELKKLKEKKEMTQDNAANIIKTKMKKYLIPFVNRVSANIYDRIVYYKKIVKNLNFDKDRNNYCVKFYKFDEKTGKPIFRIGNNIILKKEIGSGSTHGAIYLSSFRDKNNKLLKYVVKVSPISYKTPVEIKNNEMVSNAVIKNLCPHFPISYGYALCMKNNLRKSSFKASKERGITHNKDKEPKFLLSDKDYYVYLNELASGDLRTFNLNIELNENRKIAGNKIAQIFISLMFFYKTTGCYHCDAHDGNFLYHKIKEGGYYHYKIFGKDYYLPNLGYLWIVWDYEHAKSLTDPISNHKVNLKMGYDFICIMPFLLTCCNKDETTIIKKKLFTPSETSLYNRIYNKRYFHLFLKSILDCLCELRYINTTIYSSNELINKKPYIIDDISPMT